MKVGAGRLAFDNPIGAADLPQDDNKTAKEEDPCSHVWSHRPPSAQRVVQGQFIHMIQATAGGHTLRQS